MNNSSDIYKELVKILKFRFAKELRYCDIELVALYEAKNLVSKQEGYILNVNDQCIKFIEPIHFIDNFSSFLKDSIIEQKKKYEQLNRTADEFTDELRLETAMKNQYMVMYKQEQLLKKMNQLKKELK